MCLWGSIIKHNNCRKNTTNAFVRVILNHKLLNDSEIGFFNEIYSDAQEGFLKLLGIGPNYQENEVLLFTTSDFEEEKDNSINRALEVLDN